MEFRAINRVKGGVPVFMFKNILFKKMYANATSKLFFSQLCSIELRKKGSEAFNIFFVLKLMSNSSQYAKRSKSFGQKFSKTVLFVNELM